MDLLREKLRAQGHHKAQVAAAMIGSAVVGGAISAAGSKSAADTQANAANSATQSQRDMFNQTVGLESPFRNAGVGASDKLANLLGIAPSSVQQGAAVGAPGGAPAAYGGETADQIRARLQPQFMKSPNVITPVGADPEYQTQMPSDYSNVDQAGLDAAVQAEMQRQQQQSIPTASTGGLPSAPGASAAGGPGFGSLLKPFDMNDFQMDPGTQFRIKYGNQALQNSQAAQNGVMSGSALKDLIGFNQDYAGLGYQSAFDRYMANKSFTLGSLNDMANRGQAAAGNTVNSAGQFSSGISSTIQGAGNASAAGTVGMANALSGAATGSGNAYLLSNLLNGGNTKNNAQAGFSQTSAGSSGFGSGLAYGNQDMGQYL